MKTILLNPGPVSLSDGVRRALLGPDICHREPEFRALQDDLRSRLLEVYDLDPARWTAVLLTGSGTAAVEAMLTTLAPDAGDLLSIENGVYGERMAAIAAAYALPHQRLRHDWAAPVDSAALAQALAAGDTAAAAVVHHETTTGRLNDLDAVATHTRAAGAGVLLDAVSSFGAEQICFDDWGIDAVAATANKCLHGVPGTSFVIARRTALERAAARERPRSVYLDLNRYFREQERGGTPFTQSVQTFYALKAALDEFFAAGGVRARHDTYRQRIGTVREHLGSLGVAPLLPEADNSCVLQSFRLPDGMTYDALHDRLKAAGFVIYAGQGALGPEIFRISMMGEIGGADIDRLLAALDAAIRTA